MKKQILNLGKALSKAEQRNVFGGYLQECTFTYLSTYTGQWETVTSGGYADGQAGSDQANEDCVGMISNMDATRCFYDCEWDD
ncbi:hypothetical protein GCM10011416_10240 [Polaribacter pacificus]|uniref:Uncharacterized protein n=1 Tax=Polaribacter pacificus TaxID=1775173 RepID=A0A917HXL0_9FLAO|nr:hypothetical protein [Polaribacter pacificus]GGG94774.1 hypothetical protein GCM10011416_10240 [Polaribacter pacificus]